jgi:tight adherence protein C
VNPGLEPAWVQDAARLAPLAALGCVGLAALGVRLLTVETVDVTRPDIAATAPEAESVTDRLLERTGQGLARYAAIADGGRVGRRIAAAGGLNGLTPQRFFARRAGSVVFALVIGGLLIWSGYLYLGTITAVVVGGFADYRLRSAAKRRQEEIERTLPDLLDVLSITLLAGTSLRAGLTRVAQSLTGDLSEELKTLNRQMDVGVSRRQAFEQLRERNPSPSIRRFVGGVLQAEELGHSLSDTLTDLATQMRSSGAQTARRRADSTDKAISLITAAILLPALVLLVLATFLGGLSVGN